RKRLNEALLDKDMRLSYLPFIIKAVARALKNHPVLNAELDLENERIIYKNYVNIGIAMDADEGLVVPVIRDADHKSLIQVARDLKDLIDRAKERKLTLEDLKDGSFSITSYGSIGGYFAVPVINYPQVAIFGVGRMTEKPIVKDSQIAVGNMLPISMSVDHRIVDGGEVARFLNEVLGYLRDPLLLLAFEGGNHGL
ncbi:MAG TPA: 2-oxo acid dehydrogenase subunit E2, partial [Candidatus Cloacimonadota bacterium]|nr:2-oxo acid dehydrogenase subunit E2 [Candidatus Cloacimonadota bacterium]